MFTRIIPASRRERISGMEEDCTNSFDSPKDMGRWPLIAGFILALLSLGLPLIGVTVNLLLGSIALIGAFMLLAYGFWKWEKSSRWHWVWRIATIMITAIIFFTLVGHQIFTQYKRDHPKKVTLNQVTPKPISPIDQNVPVQPPQRQVIVRKASPRPVAKPINQTSRNTPEATASSVTPQTVISAPGGIAIGGGTVINPQVNNYGEPPPPPLSLRFTAEPQPVNPSATFPYSSMVTIYVNRVWEEPSVAVICDGTVGDVQIGGISFYSYMGVADSDPRIGLARRQGPPVTPDNPMVVLIYSKEPVKVIDVKPVKITFSGAPKNPITQQ